MQISFKDTKMFEQLMDEFSQIYQHEECNTALRSFIKFRLYKLFGTEYDISGHLKKQL